LLLRNSDDYIRRGIGAITPVRAANSLRAVSSKFSAPVLGFGAFHFFIALQTEDVTIYDATSHVDTFARRCKYLDEIRTLVEEWNVLTTYEVVAEPDPEKSTFSNCMGYVAHMGGPPFPELSLLLGDCLHNFRDTLDHLVWPVSVIKCDANTPPNPRRIGFPAWHDKDTY
jgi:hypothetical protein